VNGRRENGIAHRSRAQVARRLWLGLWVGLVLVSAPATADNGLRGALPGGLPGDASTWQALRQGGHAILIRHAIAPGVGDPSGLRLGECATQRNLSEEGREQARRIGRSIRSAGVTVDRVLSSRWCRGLETARLLGLGTVEPYTPLDSFFSFPERGPAAIEAMARLVSEVGSATVVLVTHQVNITGLTGVYPASGEAVVVTADPGAAGRVRVIGRLPF
jgi:phosphohistidine phosphatase SixA